MGKRIIGYVGVLLITGYFFFMYDAPVLTGILIIEIIYPLLAAVYVRWAGRKVTAGFLKMPSMAEKDQKIKIFVWLRNRSAFWNIRYRFFLDVKTRFAQRSRRIKAAGTALPGDQNSWSYTVSAKYCGILEIRIEKLQIFDPLGIFFRTVRTEEKAQVGIFPKFELMPLEITRRTREFLADADEYSVEKKGDDPSEIYQIREYTAQDTVHDIHWKLSAKEGELMVKEHGLPLGCVVLIWIDAAQKGLSCEGFGRMLEVTASLSATLVEEKCIHMAAWFEEKNGRVVKRKIDGEEAAYEWIWRLMETEPYQDKELAQIFYEEAFRGEHFSSVAVIDGDGNLTVGGEHMELIQL